MNSRGHPKWLLALLAVITAGSLLVAGGAVAIIYGVGQDTVASKPGETDIGFARDMSAHHQQAAEMASYARDRSGDPAIRLLAFDIQTTQLTQIGQMQGLLLSWGRALYGGEQMSWMSNAPGAHMMNDGDGLMPGMASGAELNSLKSMGSTAFDIYFLQLMLRHHAGALPMAQYAAGNARTTTVRTFARAMANAQAKEIVLMEQMLRARGALPIPAAR